MKKNLLTLILLFSIVSFAQQGKIYPKNKKIKQGEVNTYIYEPPAGLQIPEDAWIAGQSNSLYFIVSPLIRSKNQFEFKMNFPKTEELFVAVIKDRKNRIIDNNQNNGYSIRLNEKISDEKALLHEIILWNFSRALLDPNVLVQKQVDAYEQLLKKNSKLKNESIYSDYLILKYLLNPEETKSRIIEHISFLKKNESEENLRSITHLYYTLNMLEEAKEVSNSILTKNPKGEMARYNFINKFVETFYNTSEKTEAFILQKQEEYKSNFSGVLDFSPFQIALLQVYLKEKNMVKLEQIEKIIADKSNIADTYNDYAWELSGKDLTSSGTDLDFAETLSKKSLAIVSEKLKNPDYTGDFRRLKGSYNAFSDTYALILYKQKRHQKAFDYQHPIAEQDELDTGGKERYAAYAEKAKGLEFAKNYIEKELDRGTNSKLLTEQLERIYQELNLSKETLEIKKQQLKKLVTENAKREVINLYGDVKAPDFELENLKGEKINLSYFKGKIVVLDFWATWCGPCIASFPNMQALVNEYQDHNVAFFFIDTWERNPQEKTKNKVTEFLKEHEYTFNVLYDFDSEVAKKYKIRGIPAKVVIDKEGNIISVNSSEENIKALIEENQ